MISRNLVPGWLVRAIRVPDFLIFFGFDFKISSFKSRWRLGGGVAFFVIAVVGVAVVAQVISRRSLTRMASNSQPGQRFREITGLSLLACLWAVFVGLSLYVLVGVGVVIV